MSFADDCLTEYEQLWETMLTRPFLEEIQANELPDKTFHNWLKQDYEFVRAALPFVSILKPKAREDHVRFLSEAEVALHDELDLFRERADELGVSVEDVSKNLTTQSYIQHLIATAYREDYPVALAVYWTAERAYHESWKQVDPALSEDHPWAPFVENWAGEQFAGFVNQLEQFLNDEADRASDDQLERMREGIEWTIRYEIAFWDMAYGETGDQWLAPISR
jgi:thiaminase/transcriptional activator TenA